MDEVVVVPVLDRRDHLRETVRREPAELVLLKHRHVVELGRCDLGFRFDHQRHRVQHAHGRRVVVLEDVHDITRVDIPLHRAVEAGHVVRGRTLGDDRGAAVEEQDTLAGVRNLERRAAFDRVIVTIAVAVHAVADHVRRFGQHFAFARTPRVVRAGLLPGLARAHVLRPRQTAVAGHRVSVVADDVATTRSAGSTRAARRSAHSAARGARTRHLSTRSTPAAAGAARTSGIRLDTLGVEDAAAENEEERDGRE